MSDHTEFKLTDLDLLTLEPLSTLSSDERIILDDGKRIEVVERDSRVEGSDGGEG
jgi:hypothetical protein